MNGTHPALANVYNPGGAIVIVMTRWHMRDLTGKIVKASTQREGVDEWEIIEFPGTNAVRQSVMA